jgi:peroxiredoxin
MIVDDGIVRSLNIEETPGTADVSGAKKMLELL